MGDALAPHLLSQNCRYFALGVVFVRHAGEHVRSSAWLIPVDGRADSFEQLTICHLLTKVLLLGVHDEALGMSLRVAQ
ncbi:MAG: hypothetical protein MJE77_48145 [Proteobacteria bacterium]|nr:hypothetical protein [Pseudomonadota bacterium]